MDINKYIKLCCVQKNSSLHQIAEKSTISPQNLSNKMARGKFYFSDLEKIAEALNADISISFIDRATGKPII